jgi:hypothetical protein
VSDGRGGEGRDSASVVGVNDTPVLSYQTRYTWDANSDYQARFDIVDDGAPAEGACINASFDAGKVTDCGHTATAGWLLFVRTGAPAGGNKHLRWIYRDAWGARASGDIVVFVR